MTKNIQKNVKYRESYEILGYTVIMLTLIGIVTVSVLRAGTFI
jgi:hypothetical protein